MTIPALIIPKEHGAWAVLLVPMLLGAAAAGAWSVNILLFFLSVVTIFLGYVPVQIVLRDVLDGARGPARLHQARFWSCIYLGGGLALAAPLLVQGYILLFALAAAGLTALLVNVLLTRRAPKTIPSDLIAVSGLSLTGPGAYYVGSGTLDQHAAILWLLNLLFFGCSIFYVHMKLAAAAARKPALSTSDKLSMGKYNILYHAFVVGLVIALALSHHTRAVAVIAFLPMALHAVAGTYTLSSRVRFKTLGFILLGQSLFFAAVLWRAFS